MLQRSVLLLKVAVTVFIAVAAVGELIASTGIGSPRRGQAAAAPAPAVKERRRRRN